MDEGPCAVSEAAVAAAAPSPRAAVLALLASRPLSGTALKSCLPRKWKDDPQVSRALKEVAALKAPGRYHLHVDKQTEASTVRAAALAVATATAARLAAIQKHPLGWCAEEAPRATPEAVAGERTAKGGGHSLPHPPVTASLRQRHADGQPGEAQRRSPSADTASDGAVLPPAGGTVQMAPPTTAGPWPPAWVDAIVAAVEAAAARWGSDRDGLVETHVGGDVVAAAAQLRQEWGHWYAEHLRLHAHLAQHRPTAGGPQAAAWDRAADAYGMLHARLRVLKRRLGEEEASRGACAQEMLQAQTRARYG
jgi:hypothetical protein